MLLVSVFAVAVVVVVPTAHALTVGPAIPTGTTGSPENFALALSSDGSTLYAGGGYPGYVYPINTSTNMYTGTPIITGVVASSSQYFYSLAVIGTTLYVGGSASDATGGIYTYNTLTQTSGPTISIPIWITSLAVSGTTLYAASTGLPNIYVISGSTLENTITLPSPVDDIGALAVSGSILYAAVGDSSVGGVYTVYPITMSGYTGTVGAPISGPSCSSSLSCISTLAIYGTTLYVGSGFTGNVYPITDLTATPIVGSPITSGAAWINALAISPDGSTLYVGDGNSGNIYPITTATNAVGTTITTGATGIGALAISSDGNTLYAGDSNSGNVYPITDVAPPLVPPTATSAVNLGAAGNYVILAETAVTTTGTTHITGDIGLSPAAASSFTGFGQAMDPSGVFSTSSLVTGHLYAADYAAPTPANLGTAITNMGTAYTTANGKAMTVSEGTTTLCGQTLAPGVYTWTSDLPITCGITLSGGSSGVWIFQVPGTLTVSSGVIVTLSGGATYNNVIWVVGGQTTLGTTVEFQGIILDYTSIAMQTGATLTGRALAQAAVTLESNTITAPPVGGVTASPSTVDQGQTSSLTSTPVTTGTSPYTYQWSEEAPGASSYSTISGATSSSYTFTTSTSTAIGTWHFELQVKDSAGATVNSNAETVIIKSALVVTTTVTTTKPTTTMVTQTQTQTTTQPTTITQTQTQTTTQPTTITQTQTQTTTQPTTTTVTNTQTVTGPGTTATTTHTVTSTTTQSSSSVPAWAYAAMIVLLIAGLAVGYIIKRASVGKS